MTVKDRISSMNQFCTNCKTECSEDELYCPNCGYILPQALGGDRTFAIGSTQSRSLDLQWGTGYFHYRARLFLRLPDNDLAVPIPFATKSVIVGRKSDNVGADIDLSPFGAADLGVSRKHVCIDRAGDGLTVTDLESANGTYLNRVRLVPGEAHILRNRAVLQLGQLILRVQFA